MRPIMKDGYCLTRCNRYWVPSILGTNRRKYVNFSFEKKSNMVHSTKQQPSLCLRRTIAPFATLGKSVQVCAMRSVSSGGMVASGAAHNWAKGPKPPKNRF